MCVLRICNYFSLRWRHNDHAGVSNHQPHCCLLNRLFRRKSKKTSKLRVTGLCAGNSPGTGEFPAQMASYAENVSIWWRHHVRALNLEMLQFIHITQSSPDVYLIDYGNNGERANQPPLSIYLSSMYNPTIWPAYFLRWCIKSLFPAADVGL